MRVGELCGLKLEDIEDEGETAFFKIRRGKGGKFPQVPVSRRLCLEPARYLNRTRPDTSGDELPLKARLRPNTCARVGRLSGRAGSWPIRRT